MENLERTLLSLKEKVVIGGFVFLKLCIHLYLNFFNAFGIFRDEFYYLACAKRLAAGYVDHPPLSVLILKINTMLFGDSLFAIRLVPALAGALTVLFTALLVKRFGGSTKAIAAASLALMGSPVLSGMFNFYSMNSIDILFWVVAVWLFMKVNSAKENRCAWIGLGVITGLGLMNKIGMGFLAAGLAVGFLVAGRREELRKPWPWLAAVIAILIFSPFLIWNLTNGNPHLEFIDNASNIKYGGLNALSFLKGQINEMGPFNFPLGLIGFLFLFIKKEFRGIGIAVATVLGILLLNGHSKAQYLSPAYSVLFAAGAVQLVNWLKKGFKRHLVTTYMVLIAITGFLISPLVLPVLPVDATISYFEILGVKPDSEEGKEMGDLPQHFADRMGWENMAETISYVYKGLSEEDKSQCVIIAGNYGEAASLEYFSGKYPLPKVISTHNNYWLWGFEDIKKEYKVYIVPGKNRKFYEKLFETVEKKALINCINAMPYETNLPVYVCRGMKEDIEKIWTEYKNYN